MGAKSGINIVSGIDSITLFFDQNVNLSDLKIKILSKVNNLDSKAIVIRKKLENKLSKKNAKNCLYYDGML